jgi:hypothetical protein
MGSLARCVCLSLVGLLPGHPASAESTPVFRLETTEIGAHRVTFEALALSGLEGPQSSSRLALSNRGTAVPIWVEDGGDGVFGPGDAIEWTAERLPGKGSTYDELLLENAYLLSLAEAHPARLTPAPATVPGAAVPEGPTLRRHQHLESDELLLRFPLTQASPDDVPPLWYWTRLTGFDGAPYRIPLALPGLSRQPGAELRLRVALRGWSRPISKPDPAMSDHRVEVLLGGRLVASGEWGQQQTTIIETPPLAAAELPADLTGLALELRVPLRQPVAAGDPLVDVVVLDWIEVDYHWAGTVASGEQLRLWTAGSPSFVAADAVAPLALHADHRITAAPSVPAGRPGLWLPSLASGAVDVLGGPAAWHAPSAIERLPPPRLRDPAFAADYVMLVPAALRAAVAPLVALHRGRGLRVEVVDPEEVYAEFGGGLRHPRAIRDFLASLVLGDAERGLPPRPLRFVLLVGDASWDTHDRPASADLYPDAVYAPAQGAAFAHIASTDYSGPTGRARNLIPTWSYSSQDGHAADDGWFVRFGDDPAPRLAIGRLPVATPEEAAAVVAKTVRYETSAPPGDWRSHPLLVANEQVGFQIASDHLAAFLASVGLEPRRIYPQPGVPAGDAEEPGRIRQELDDGVLLIHFVGHGGRFIWRTGPADWTKHRDLFNLDDLDRLAPSDRLALVISMTCYSAPFDHPTADSIGEKFLRLPDRGAVAVIAASWRNAPSEMESQAILRGLLTTETVGEALVAAKRAAGNPDFVHQYNLLGDPAVTLAWPPGLVPAARSFLGTGP